MSKFHIWGDLPPVTFRTPPTDSTEQKTPARHIAALEISLVLREIGKDPIAIDTADMEHKYLRAAKPAGLRFDWRQFRAAPAKGTG
jgi:hypothetical protein